MHAVLERGVGVWTVASCRLDSGIGAQLPIDAKELEAAS